MAITAALVKELRGITGAGMMDCKKALVETDGDVEAAIEFLQIKGMAKAAKKSGRVAAEGLVQTWVNDAGTSGVLIEVNCETDFVSRNEAFQDLVSTLANVIGPSDANTLDEVLALQVDGESVEGFLKAAISKIGENIQLRRFVRYDAPKGMVGTYIHAGSQIGVLIAIDAEEGSTERTNGFARDVCMHIAAMSPGFLNTDVIDPEEAASQERIFLEMVKEEGKPEKIIPRIVEGKMNKWSKESSLVDQTYVKNPDLTVGEFQDEAGVVITAFTRYGVGDGIVKEEGNLADEVAALRG